MAEDIGIPKSLPWSVKKVVVLGCQENSPLQHVRGKDLRLRTIPCKQAQECLVVCYKFKMPLI